MIRINLKRSLGTLAVTAGLLGVAAPTGAAFTVDMGTSESLKSDKSEVSMETLENAKPSHAREIDVWETLHGDFSTFP